MRKTKLFTTALLGTALMLAISCDRDSTFRGWEYMPDMYRGPAIEAYEPYARMNDSLSALHPAKGTVARGFLAYQEFSPAQSGYDSAKAMLTMPEFLPKDSVGLANGKELYSIFCDHCHGDKGDGNGNLVQDGKYLGVPSYADRDINLGTIFHVVTYGKGVMGSHASQITPKERWEIGRYVMKLRADLTGETGTESEDANTNNEQAEAAAEGGSNESTQG